MGHFTYISFNRAVSDKQFEEMLTKIVDEHFGDCFEVDENWAIRPKDGVVESLQGRQTYVLQIFRHYDYKTGKPCKGKFSHKRMLGGPWSNWFVHQLHGYFCSEYNAKLSSEGEPGTYKTDPNEYPSAREYNLKVNEFYRENPEHLEKWLKRVPEKLREIRG